MRHAIILALRKNAPLLVAGFVVVGSGFLFPRVEPLEHVVAEAPAATPAPTPTPTPEPTPTPVPVFRPEVVAIPALGVEAPIVPVGTEADGAMGTPDNEVDVGWWDQVPAGGGNTLLAGHVNWQGRPGSFGRLAELSEGDEIVVRGDGRELVYRVAWVEQVSADTPAAEILGDQGEPVVTLITCGGEFDRRIRSHRDRVIVRGVLA